MIRLTISIMYSLVNALSSSLSFTAAPTTVSICARSGRPGRCTLLQGPGTGPPTGVPTAILSGQRARCTLERSPNSRRSMSVPGVAPTVVCARVQRPRRPRLSHRAGTGSQRQSGQRKVRSLAGRACYPTRQAGRALATASPLAKSWLPPAPPATAQKAIAAVNVESPFASCL